MKKIVYLLLLISFVACEKDINPPLGDAAELLVIDAWLDNAQPVQNIYITRSQPYFESSDPVKVGGAAVSVFGEDGTEYVFDENDSAYTWIDPNGSGFGTVGENYRLQINVGSEIFLAFSDMGRVPEIDSIKFNFRKKDFFVTQDYYLAEFLARDLEGEGDTYWIKSWKNGQYLNKPGEINVTWDAAFTQGGGVDGTVFIQPIQDAINPIDEDPENDNEFIPPFLVGDSVYVEIHSINTRAFFFLQEVIIQTNREGGFGALFATPLANVSTNIVNGESSSDVLAVGFFNVAAVNGRGRRLTEELALAAKEEALKTGQ